MLKLHHEKDEKKGSVYACRRGCKSLVFGIEAERYRRRSRSAHSKQQRDRDNGEQEHTGRGLVLASQARVRLPKVPAPWHGKHRDGMDDSLHGRECVGILPSACQWSCRHSLLVQDGQRGRLAFQCIFDFRIAMGGGILSQMGRFGIYWAVSINKAGPKPN